MPPYHRLLARQLARHLGTAAVDDPALAALLDDVDRAYAQADAERELLERSLELTSNELLARNQELATAMRQAALSFWAWDPDTEQLSIQGVAPVGLPEVRGRATFDRAALLARVYPADRERVAAALAQPGIVDVEFRDRDGARWVRMRGDRVRQRSIGVWADVTTETLARQAQQHRREVAERQNRTLQRLAELLVEGVAMPTALSQVCADLCDTLDVGSASVWLISDDGTRLDCVERYDRARGAVAPRPPPLVLAEMPNYLGALAAHRTVAVNDLATDTSAGEIGERARAFGLGAMLDSPCRVGRQLVGMVCCEHHATPRTWRPDEQAFVASVADGVSLAIESARRGHAERERAALEEGLRQAQKMESLGHLAGGVAHDLNNLLTPIMICGELVRESVAADPELVESTDAILAAATSARDLVAQLLAFGRKQMLQLRPLSVNAVCERAVKLLSHSLPPTITVALDLDPEVPRVVADATQLQQVIVNLAINARDAMPEGGRLVVATAATGDLDNPQVVVQVIDDGVGIDAQTLPHIFEPFFTTKGGGRGTGLGLAMVYGIVKQHGGTIEVTSRVGHGTRFQVRLPVAERTRPSSGRIALPPELRNASGPATVLVVEDDPMVLDLVTTVLRREGYLVIDAPSPLAAIDLASLHPGDVDLVLTDVVMPHMNGVQMFEQIIRHRPRARVVFMSGYGQDALASHSDSPLLHKPFTVSGLVAAVRAALTAAPGA